MPLKHSYLGEILSYYLNGSSYQEMQSFGDFRNNSSKARSSIHYNFRDGKCRCCCLCFVRCFGRKARSDSFLGIQFDLESPEKYFEGEAEVNVVNLEHYLVINV